MDEPFEAAYAGFYDLLYYDKDYAAECDFIEGIFRAYGSHPITTILDGGCGTGGHAILLAQRGYQVTGLDRSVPMIALAQEKAAQEGLSTDFRIGDLRQLDLGRSFDACICMFAVISYQVENRDLQSVLRGVRRHLRRGGLLVFDIWYGPAVLRVKPEPRLKVVEAPSGRLFRFATSQLDIRRHINQVDYWLLLIDRAKERLVKEVREQHEVRYLFPQEIAYHLETAGFELLSLSPFLDLHGVPTEETWSVCVVARAIS